MGCAVGEAAGAPGREDVQPELDALVARSLGPVSLGLTALYVLYAVAHPWLLPPGVGPVLGAGAAVVAAAFLGTWAWSRRHPVPAEWAHPAVAALTGLALAHGLWVLHATGDPFHTVYLALIAVGAGLFALSTPWLLGLFALIFLSWTSVALLHPDAAGWAKYGFVLLASTTVAGLAHGMRTGNLAHMVADRLAEERSRRRFQALSDASHEGVLLLSEGRIVDGNRAAEPLLGPLAALKGRPLEEVLGGALPAPGEGAELVSDRGAKRRHLSVRRTQLDPARGTDVVLLRDVTLEKEAQARETELARLQEQDAIRTRFFDRLGRELSDHILPLMDHAESMRVGAHGTLTPRQVGALKVMESEMRQLDWLIQELIDSANVDTERLELIKDSVDFEDLVNSCLASARTVFEAKQVDLRVGGVAPAWVRGDSRRLEQVVKEVLDHALRHTPRGGQVHALLRTAGDEALVEVRDGSEGLAPDESPERLFEPFAEEREDEVGLGLFVARGIARRHGGTLAASSDGRGKGTRFELRLPLEGPEPRADRADTAAVGTGR